MTDYEANIKDFYHRDDFAALAGVGTAYRAKFLLLPYYKG